VRTADNLTTSLCWLSWIWEPQPPGTLRACRRSVMGLLLVRTAWSTIWWITENCVQAGCQTAGKITTRCVTHLTRFLW